MVRHLSTARTFSRPFTMDDAEATFEWFSDPEVMRHIPFGGDNDLQATEARLRRYMDHQEANGFSKWIVSDRVTGEPIGDAGFFLMPDGKRVELGYRFRRTHWAQGYATEVAAGWLEVARPWFDLEVVYAFAKPENAASLKVLQKLGFRFTGDEVLYGVEVPVWSRATLGL